MLDGSVQLHGRLGAFAIGSRTFGDGEAGLTRDHVKRSLPDVSAEALSDYVRGSGDKTPVEARLTIDVNYRLVPLETFSDYMRVPEATITVSSVGFDAAMTQALVYVTYSCGGGMSECGNSFVAFLTKGAAGWTFVKAVAIQTA
jgi:hypothetical protein